MLHVYKAQATGNQVVEDVVVSIETAFPGGIVSLGFADAIFSKEAEALESALYGALPGGTYDRLLGKMLERKATHFVVAHKS